MSIASVTTSPLYFNSSRSNPVKIFREVVAGTLASGSNAGTAKCPGITDPTLAPIQCNHFADLVRQVRIVRRPYRHRRWKRGPFIQPHPRPALEIRADQQR